MTINVKGLRINYIDSEVGDEILLFLHGWGAPVTAYRSVLAPLEPYYRVIAFDMPGVGGSQEPENPLTVEDYVDFAEEFCKILGITECTLVCHSHGGRVSVGLMTRPGCAVSVTRAVFIDAAGVPPKRGAGYKIRQRAYKCLRFLGTNRLTAPLFSELYEVTRKKRSSADYRAASPVMRQTLTNVVNSDMRPLMPKITVPVLLVWGENDTATPLSDGREMESLIPGSGLAVIASGSHFPFVENPSQFSAVMAAFLCDK